jgi:hypothetical protein
MTNQEKIKQADKLIREVLISEVEIINGNETSLKMMSKDIVDTIVNHWYLYREPEIFMSEDGEEIDEFLNVEEYRY